MNARQCAMRGSTLFLRSLTWALLVAAAAVAAQGSPAERARIDAERRQVETRFANVEADCRRRFFVTICLDGAKTQRRQAMDALRQQELALDDAEPRQRADGRRRAVEARQAEVAGRAPAASQLEAPARVAPAATASASAAPVAPAANGRPRDASASEAAARRAAEAERRRAEAAALQARIAQRESERASAGQRSAPLPPRPQIRP